MKIKCEACAKRWATTVISFEGRGSRRQDFEVCKRCAVELAPAPVGRPLIDVLAEAVS